MSISIVFVVLIVFLVIIFHIVDVELLYAILYIIWVVLVLSIFSYNNYIFILIFFPILSFFLLYKNNDEIQIVDFAIFIGLFSPILILGSSACKKENLSDFRK